jgi:hypothetical protein
MSSLRTERRFVARRAALIAFAPLLAASAIAAAAQVDPRVLDSATREGSVDVIIVLQTRRGRRSRRCARMATRGFVVAR